MSDNAEAVAVDTRARKKRDEYAPRLPDAVRRQAARAEELAQEQQAAQDAEQQNEEQVQAAEQSEQQPVEIAPVEQPPTPAPDEALWQSRYQSLQGKYNAEIPSLRQQVQHLEHLIASMHAAPAAQPPAQIDLQPAEDLIPEDDYAAYGPEFVDSSRRWARVEAAQQTRPLERQIQELREYQENLARERTQDTVRSELNRDPDLAGRWEQIDHDQNFHAWLAEPDPFSGARRHDMLRAAYASGDAVRTGRFFKAYLEQTAPERYSPLPAPQTPRLTNGSNGAGPRVDLAQYAAPGRASNATPGIGGARPERLWSNREIAAFYSNKLRGSYRGREAEAEALELDIVAAGREGRVRNT